MNKDTDLEQILFDFRNRMMEFSEGGKVMEVVLNRPAYQAVENFIYTKPNIRSYMINHLDPTKPKHIEFFGMKITRRD